MTGAPSRMLALLSLLQTRREWPGQLVAERLGVTTRTVRRDVDRLRELGYRITAVKGPGGGYRLEAGSELPPLLFDDEQALAIAVALRNAAESGVEIEEAAERALATIRRMMPSRLRHRLDNVRFTGRPAPPGRVDPQVLEAVGAALRDRATLRFGYRDPEAPPRRAEPHGLVARAGRWYLVAWDLAREDWRVYRLDRMTPRTPTGPRFARREIPTGDAATFLDARMKGSQEANRWPCVGRFEISLPATEVAAWLPEGSVTARTDRSCLVTAGSWSWAGLLADMMRFDAPFRVIAPTELAEAAGLLARRLGSAAEPARATG